MLKALGFKEIDLHLWTSAGKQTALYNLVTVADKKSSRFRCVQRRFVSVPLAFRFRFPLRFVAESVPYKVNGGQTVKNKYACLSYEYYN